MDQSITTGSRVSHQPTGRVGTVTRVITRDGLLGGIAEVRWDGQRLSRSAGFFPGQELRPEATGLRHRDGFVTFG
jgi:hypothetical protein